MAMITIFCVFVDIYYVVIGGVVGLVFTCFWWCSFVYMYDLVVDWVQLCF